MLKNNNNAPWPPNGRTKLINDINSDIKCNDVLLNNLHINQYQLLSINLNIKNLRAGIKYCIFHFTVDDKKYGNPLVITVNIKEDKRVEEFRNMFQLKQEEFDSKDLLDTLTKNNFDYNLAFQSLFGN